MSFQQFASLVHDQFNRLAAQNLLFTVNVDLWPHYLASFPDGTNPIFKTNTEHDCSCCRHFVRNIGNVVAMIDGKVHSVWDIPNHDPTYDVVAACLRSLVQQAPITSVYGASERFHHFGAHVNYDPANDHNWHHFHADVPRKHWRTPTNISDLNTTYQVLKRGLEEVNIIENLETVRDLITANSLYRGQEHLAAVRSFHQMVKEYQATQDKQAYLWAHLASPQARFRNTVIGTLVVDLCDGVDLERAVASFESKVAPANYKRPKALITPKMIDAALETLDKLNLREAVDRRMANFGDLSVNDVLFVDNSVQPMFRDGLKDLLMTQVKPKAPDTKSATPITIDALLALKPTSMALLVENKHLGHFMTLTAPKHKDTGQLFKWNNDFAWSYDGNVTDSIKERVKKAGGNVTNAEFRISLSWFNYDDLDLHVVEPSNNRINFRNKDGKLDVDMNAGSGTTRQAVENVSYKPGQARLGVYTVIVDNFYQRERIDVGFELEVEYKGQVFNYTYDKVVPDGLKALQITLQKDTVVIQPAPGVVESSRSHEKWGINTQTFAPVETVTISPNYWGDNHIGNKHWFFILKGCINPEPTRGLYNEFLASPLEAHRKVFELLADQTKAEATRNQLSGLGFSSTLGEEVFVQINGNQTYKVLMQ